MLAIELTFLTGRYVATSYNDRRRAEWPPHPARLFSALVATHFAAESPASEERQALRWLEALAPPEIAHSAAAEREVVTVFVPVNDIAVLKNFDEEAAEIDAARAAKARNAEKLAKRLSDAIQKEIAPPKKVTKEGPDTALALLPEHRVRQPRTFPSVTPEDPRVTYVWPEATPSREQHVVLDRLLSRLVRVGHSSSLVSARVVDSPPPTRTVPVDTATHSGGQRLRTTSAGQLDALEAAFARHQETEPRIMPTRFQAYAPLRSSQSATTPRSVFCDEWLVLRRAGGPALPITAGPGVGRAIRRALLSGFGDDPIPEVISGHSPSGKPSGTDHLGVVPLPFVAAPHADGSLLGVALLLPRSASDADRHALYRALAHLEKGARKLPENGALAEGEVPVVPLTLGRAGIWLLERVVGVPKLTNLRIEAWLGPSTSWVTSTPVALDRNPGDLHGRDPSKVSTAVAEASASVRAACGRIGLPEPVTVEILPAPPLAGAAKTRHYPRFSNGAEGRLERVLTHARIAFDTPVQGPILLGAGRYFGLGLFRPEPRHG